MSIFISRVVPILFNCPSMLKTRRDPMGLERDIMIARYARNLFIIMSLATATGAYCTFSVTAFPMAWVIVSLISLISTIRFHCFSNQAGIRLIELGQLTYMKGKTKTNTLVPTIKERDGGLLGIGFRSEVYSHRLNPQLAVKKSIKINLSASFQLASQMDHPCINKAHKFFIKQYPNGEKSYKIIMDKIKGNVLDKHYKDQNNKLANDLIVNLLTDVKDTLVYLFENNIFWGDINEGNAFVTPEGRLMLCDFDRWCKENDAIKKTEELFLGTIQLVGLIIRSSSVRKNGENPSVEPGILYPKEFFNVPPRNPMDSFAWCTDTEWWKAICNDLQKLSDSEKLHYIMRYIDCVSANFIKCMTGT